VNRSRLYKMGPCFRTTVLSSERTTHRRDRVGLTKTTASTAETAHAPEATIVGGGPLVVEVFDGSEKEARLAANLPPGLPKARSNMGLDSKSLLEIRAPTCDQVANR